ncbi:serine protease inhibitor 42Dd-like isoform X2 [Drosophila subpulchrella]|uniref:serine protease inhibitor 42Dd-like isoform X2 n=1 Tax=Drosophila subpulchrella TaxID=1486046 RepID=UPI0018A14E29|nr:serine protease inhibitor 42Dd-like isoform X2 [Drosophila subpulchrella]
MKFINLILLATSVTGQFTDDFYKQLAKDNANKNLISSPLSVDIALRMVYMGAGGKTAQEMRDVLKLPADTQKVARKYKKFLTYLEEREKVAILNIANRIYVNDRYSIVPEFNQVVNDSFKAEAEAISVNDPDKAASIINKWVNDQTRSRIKTIVTNKDTSSNMTMVLLNAIYFKGQWKYKFDPEETKKANFKTADKKTVPVQMMKLIGSFKVAHVKALDAKVIELPYRNSSLFMVIFLPNKVDGLQKLEKKIAGFSTRLPMWNVNLKLPKFKIEFSSELKGVLGTMGIKDAFSANANFEGLVKTGEPRISKVIHKAFIEVNEEGAKKSTAAVTGSIGPIVLRLTNLHMDFTADHPFAYVIRDKDTIYFQGHFVRP